MRLGRRWNLDPVIVFPVSPYAVFQGNPILFSDPLGNTIKTNEEGGKNTINGLNGILDKNKNPVSYADGELKYGDNVDVSGYSELQRDVLGRYKTLIDDKMETTLHIVNRNEEISDGRGGKTSLAKQGAEGITYSHYETNESGVTVVTSTDVYVARNPAMSHTVTTGGGTIGNVSASGTTTIKLEPEEPEFAGITNLHEIGGHAYQNFKFPALTGKELNDNNKAVENFVNKIYKVFKINNSIWYKSRKTEHPRYVE